MIKKLKPKSEFSRNVLTLMTGTTIAQAIPIAISPILTRIYSPEDFGIFALYISIAVIFATLATGRYELAIMLPKKDEDAVNIAVLSVMITIAVSIFTFLIVLVFNKKIAMILGNIEICNWLYLIPLTVLLTGLYQNFNYWNNRRKQYKRMAVSRVIRSTTIGSTNLGMGFGGFGASGLIVGDVVGQTVTVSVLGKMIWREDSKLLKYVNRLKIFALAKKHKKFPLLNLPNGLIDSFRLSGISILIAKFFTTATLGQFSLAWKIVQVPITLIGGSLAQVFFQKLSRAHKGDLYGMVKKFIVKASLIAAPMFLIVYFFSVDIFIFVFGENWELAGTLASIMAPWLFLNFVSSPLSSLFIILNKHEVMLKFSILFMIVPLIIIIICKNESFIEVLSLVTLAMSVMLIMFIAMVLHYTKQIKETY